MAQPTNGPVWPFPSFPNVSSLLNQHLTPNEIRDLLKDCTLADIVLYEQGMLFEQQWKTVMARIEESKALAEKEETRHKVALHEIAKKLEEDLIALWTEHYRREIRLYAKTLLFCIVTFMCYYFGEKWLLTGGEFGKVESL